jgi:DNA modification methylase
MSTDASHIVRRRRRSVVRSPRWRIRRGDCVKVMPTLPANSVDAVVSDPPYGLEFMGAQWDRLGDIGQASHAGFSALRECKGFQLASYSASCNLKCQRCQRWKWASPARRCNCGAEAIWPNVRAVEGQRIHTWHLAWAEAALRVLKPGGHLLAFGGTRTFHRLTCALEDAGFEIRDCMCWLYGQGFPKSLNISNALQRRDPRDAERWRGWGTGLKPAWEPIVIARKPMGGTVAQNIHMLGTGGLNIDGCRVAFRGQADERSSKAKNRHADFKSKARKNAIYGRDERSRGNYDPPGRWPANVALSHTERCRQAGHTRIQSNSHHPAARGCGGISTSGHKGQRQLVKRSRAGELVGVWECAPDCPVQMLDQQSGGASRFFYCAKASSAERNAGLDQSDRATIGDGRNKPMRNTHPTVKPIALMRHLVRLVTPPGGVVLDPFTGSGSTGVAAVLEGARFIGIEREPEYIPIARARIRHWAGRSGKRERP